VILVETSCDLSCAQLQPPAAWVDKVNVLPRKRSRQTFAMKIWHAGASSNPFRVDGVSRTVWLLSRHQAALGHEVSLIVDTPPTREAFEIAAEAGMKLIHVQANYLSYPNEIRRLVAAERPDLVHQHSVFVIRQSTMSRVLDEARTPYVITPHGGLAPQVLKRGVIKKSLYGWLRERPRFMGAQAIGLVTPGEEQAVRAFIPDYQGLVRWMPNPVEIEDLDANCWQGVQKKKRIVFLGRFDVLVKGIDILVEISRRLPEVQFDLYGSEDPKTIDWLNRLRQDLPSNVQFHEPVFGAEKGRTLASASMYLQPSRWEGFPISVAESLYLGVPSGVTETLNLAAVFEGNHMGLTFPADPALAAQRIGAALEDESRLRAWSTHGQAFARQHFHPVAAAKNHIQFYRDVLEGYAPRGIRSDERINGDGSFGDHSPGSSRWNMMPAEMRGSVKHNVSRMVERSSKMLGADAGPRTVILCYHSINTSHADLSVDPAVFRNQLAFLRREGYEFLSFGDLVKRIMRWGRPKNSIACITFDDGYEDNLTQAAPILSEMNIPATTFITSGLMMNDATVRDHFHRLTRYETTYLTPRQAAELARCGVEIGAHTYSHPNLARLSHERVREEVTRSKAMLEDVIGHAVQTFAYPFGKKSIHYNEMTVGVVRESGFLGAAAVAFRAVTSRESIRMFEMPRFFINRSDTPISFEQKVRGHFDWLGSIQETTPAWLKAILSPEDKY
jgi:glycosyltransferase involved in cell wall biosynthesis/peptidoglycan/xylan/chitin deacetylase (PgdA/CDA1 family)